MALLIRMAVLMLSGDHEVLYDPRRAICMAKERIPHVQAELVAGAGHFLLTDQSEQVNHKTAQFLKGGTL